MSKDYQFCVMSNLALHSSFAEITESLCISVWCQHSSAWYFIFLCRILTSHLPAIKLSIFYDYNPCKIGLVAETCLTATAFLLGIYLRMMQYGWLLHLSDRMNQRCPYIDWCEILTKIDHINLWNKFIWEKLLIDGSLKVNDLMVHRGANEPQESLAAPGSHIVRHSLSSP